MQEFSSPGAGIDRLIDHGLMGYEIPIDIYSRTGLRASVYGQSGVFQ